MLTNPSIRECIQQRVSKRSYSRQPLEPVLLQAIDQELKKPRRLPFPGECRFQLLEEKPDEGARKIGTYGTISGAAYFLAGAVKKAPFDLENFGFAMEELILFLTGLGLGTCWLGGTFNRSAFSSRILAGRHEWLPAVTPVGYAAPSQSFMHHLLRWSAKSPVRKPWPEIFFANSHLIPLTREQAGVFAPVLDMLRLAPSASNRQPWRILMPRPGVFHFYLQRNPMYAQVSKALMNTDDLQRVDMGIAMCHFELTARELQLAGKWTAADPRLPGLPEHRDYIASWMG